jgi:hypothetical protein
MIDVAPQHLETGVRRRVKDGNVMLLENIAHLRLGKIQRALRELEPKLRRLSKLIRISPCCLDNDVGDVVFLVE